MNNTGGRLDVLVKGIVERLISASNNPVAQAMYPAYKEGIDGLIEEYLAPRTKTGRIIRVKPVVDKPKRTASPKSRRATVSDKENGSYTVVDV